LKSTSPLAARSLDIYLQGSYANATNIYGDIDIDVVVSYTFHKDMGALTLAEQQTIPPPRTALEQLEI